MIAGQLLPASIPDIAVSDFTTRTMAQSAVMADIQVWDLGPYWQQECGKDSWADVQENVSGLATCNRCGI